MPEKKLTTLPQKEEECELLLGAVCGDEDDDVPFAPDEDCCFGARNPVLGALGKRLLTAFVACVHQFAAGAWTYCA